MNTIWFFGDCYTWGYGCEYGQPYYEYKRGDDLIWTYIVSETLDMKHKKPPYGMGAIPYIINNFIKYMPQMKKGDIVVISDSKPQVVLAKSRKKNRISSIGSENYDNFDAWLDEEEKEVTLNFINKHIEPYKELWEDFYKDQIFNLAHELLHRDIKTYFWSHHLWNTEKRFHTIAEDTNYEIDDFHFSWKGHREMADYILDKIENDDYIKRKIL